MALTGAFRETVHERAQRDAGFRKVLLTDAMNAHLGGDEATGKAVLRDVINATIGFEQLAAERGEPSKSLHRMLGPNGNPSTANFFAILQVLQKRIGVRLTVKAARGLVSSTVSSLTQPDSTGSNQERAEEFRRHEICFGK